MNMDKNEIYKFLNSQEECIDNSRKRFPNYYDTYLERANHEKKLVNRLCMSLAIIKQLLNEIDNLQSSTSEEETEKIKVVSAEIIVAGLRHNPNKPYYEIKYKEVGNDYYTIGYGSYTLAFVIEWLNTCFEIVGEDNH